MKTVTLKHNYHTLPRRAEPVYDGWYEAFDGLVTLPIDNVNHVRALWFRGYQTTPEGQSIRDFVQLDEYLARVAAEESAPKTAESAEVTDEGNDTGRQPDTEHRVRSRKRKSRKKTTE